MSKSQMKQAFPLRRKPGQTFKEYYTQEVEYCRERLHYAVRNAARDEHGKPVFYTICRHVSRSGLTRTISLHYFDTATNRMLHLNYVAAVLLDRPKDILRDGLLCRGGGMDIGFELVYTLSQAATGDGYAVSHHWL